MTNKTHRNFDTTPSSVESGRAFDKARVLSVLCVYDNPGFLDRICRYLERKGNISVDISISAESALDLMRYVLFDVIVADYTLGLKEKNVFLKTIRDAGNTTPFIYSTRIREADAEALSYGEVYFIEWGGESIPQGFEKIYLSILKAVDGHRERKNFPQGVCL